MSNVNFLIYCSGHDRKGDGAWMIQNETAEISYITAFDLLKIIRLNSILFNMVSQFFGSIKNLIISDSCYSGNYINELSPIPLLSDKITILASCSNTELSFDTSNSGNFTNALIAKNNQQQ